MLKVPKAPFWAMFFFDLISGWGVSGRSVFDYSIISLLKKIKTLRFA